MLPDIYQTFNYQTPQGSLKIRIRDWNFSDKRNYQILIEDEDGREYTLEIPNKLKARLCS